MTEYGGDTLAGMHSVTPMPWDEEYQVELLDMYHRVFDRVDAVVGEQVWNFADFATGPGIMRVGGNKNVRVSRGRRREFRSEGGSLRTSPAMAKGALTGGLSLRQQSRDTRAADDRSVNCISPGNALPLT